MNTNPSLARGFTLIELIVVMAIISLLVVALRPAISSALGQSEEAETSARMQVLKNAALSFQEEYGQYPPDDFKGLGAELKDVKAKSDTINPGIESMLLFISQSPNGGTDMTEYENWLDNTDGDDNGTAIPLLDRTAKMEVVDGWGTPFAYFLNRNYKKTQTIRTVEGDDIIARAYKNPNSAGFLAPRKYQLISAGPDLEFNTDDDLVMPPLPKQ